MALKRAGQRTSERFLLLTIRGALDEFGHCRSDGCDGDESKQHDGPSWREITQARSLLIVPHFGQGINQKKAKASPGISLSPQPHGLALEGVVSVLVD